MSACDDFRKWHRPAAIEAIDPMAFHHNCRPRTRVHGADGAIPMPDLDGGHICGIDAFDEAAIVRIDASHFRLCEEHQRCWLVLWH